MDALGASRRIDRVKRHIDALKTGASNLARPPMTLRYPDQYEVLEGYRGPPGFDMKKCIGCSLCAQICPARAIKMYRIPGFRTPRPGIDYSRCIYCGYCVDICPTGALFHFNSADFIVEKLEDAIFTPVEWDALKLRTWAEKRGKPVRAVVDEEVGLRYEPESRESSSTDSSGV